MDDPHFKKKDRSEQPAATVEDKFRELLDLIVRLRSPGGCPWDRSQKKGDVGGYLIEEAYEVLEALDSASPEPLMEELGDLLFHILFLARLAEEEGEFDMAAVLTSITEKMIRRHPHVFGDAVVNSVEEVRENWERIKKDQENKGIIEEAGLLQGVPHSLSTLARAQCITAKASGVGFDWGSATEVVDKLEEELSEFRVALGSGNPEHMKEEVGDLFFTLVNLCRFVRVDAEAALRASLAKFTQRFAHIEKALADRGRTPAGSSPAEMEKLWNEAKKKPEETLS